MVSSPFWHVNFSNFRSKSSTTPLRKLFLTRSSVPPTGSQHLKMILPGRGPTRSLRSQDYLTQCLVSPTDYTLLGGGAVFFPSAQHSACHFVDTVKIYSTNEWRGKKLLNSTISNPCTKAPGRRYCELTGHCKALYIRGVTVILCIGQTPCTRLPRMVSQFWY